MDILSRTVLKLSQITV